MNLIISNPPDGSLTVLGSTLANLAARGQFGSRALSKAHPEQLTVTTPHQVFTMGIADLIERPTLSSAKPTGWRYLVEVEREVVAAAETAIGNEDTHAFSHINHGPFVAGTVQALAAAERLAADRDSEVRLLHIPALYFVALWLTPPQSTDDSQSVLLPVAPAPDGIEANRAYPAGELLETLAERARSIPDLRPDDDRGGS
jgi:hypothetical protein